MPTFDHRSLRHWFVNHKRPLPWRKNPTPYSVWVSEIMLQQTQASVVIPYFERWMKRFPTLETLAKSSVEEVIKLWEGLGYYSRAKNLHRGAQMVCQDMQAEIPQKVELLVKIPGLGPYTVNAIRAFAFHQKTAAVDANVLRLLSRYFAIREDIGRINTQKTLRKSAEELLPSEQPWIIAEALIELGALVCKKKPLCHSCPLQSSCQAYQQGLTEILPLKAKRAATTYLHRTCAVLLMGQKLLIRQIPEGELMGGLHEFPYFETSPEGISTEEVVAQIASQFQIQATPLQKLSPLSHSFTRFSASLSPILLTCPQTKAPPGYFWASPKSLQKLPFSSGHRRLLEQLLPKISSKSG